MNTNLGGSGGEYAEGDDVIRETVFARCSLLPLGKKKEEKEREKGRKNALKYLKRTLDAMGNRAFQILCRSLSGDNVSSTSRDFFIKLLHRFAINYVRA